MASADHTPAATSGTLPPLDARVLGAVFVGGALGTLARAELAQAWSHGPAQWPWPTFLVNLVGAALLGVIATRTARRPHVHGLLGTGLCGGLTTFSTFQLEVIEMVDAGAHGLAIAYLSVSLVAGLLAAAVAAGVARTRTEPA